MFKKVLRALFSSLVNQPRKVETQPTLDRSSSPSLASTTSKPKAKTRTTRLKNDTPLNSHDYDFLGFLFGESQLMTESDPFSDFIADRIESLLLSPSALLNELPVMPASVTTLMSELKSDNFNISELIKVIEREPSMAADVIKIANSARYRRSDKQITDLKRAFMNIGSQGMVEGVIDSYVKNFTPTVNIYWRYFGEKIWQHSIQTACFAKELIKDSKSEEDQATAYFNGLICNLGKMIIFQVMVEAFRHVDPAIPPNSNAFKKLINSYAIQLTYSIAKFWKLPKPVLNAISCQASHKYDETPLAQVVFEANYLSELNCLLESKLIDAETFKQRCQHNLISPSAHQLAERLLIKVELQE